MKSRYLHRIFDTRRALADDTTRLKGSCSEFLGLFGLLRHWVELEVPNDVALMPHKASFARLCGIMDVLLEIKRGMISPRAGATRLAADCSEFLRLHKVASPVSCKLEFP